MEQKITYGIVALAVGSFAISFEKLFDVAVAAEIPWPLAVIYGGIAEGICTIATLAATRLRGWARAYASLVVVAAFGYSLWVNAVPHSVPHWAVRAVPVIAVLSAVHLGIIIREAQIKEAAISETEAKDRLAAVAQREMSLREREAQVAQFAAEVESQRAAITDHETEIEAATAPAQPDYANLDVNDIPSDYRGLLGARIMAIEAPSPQARSYWAKRVREITEANLS